MPKPKRQYDSVEFALDKRFANNWSLRASYLWSRLYGNYSGSVAVGRERPHQPERRPSVRLPGDDVRRARRPRLRPAGDGSSAPVQGAVHLPVQLRHERRRQRVRGERHAGNARDWVSCRPATTRSSTWAAAATVGRTCSRRPTCSSSTSSSSAAAAAAGELQRLQPVQPGGRRTRSTRPTRRSTVSIRRGATSTPGSCCDFDPADQREQGVVQDPRFLQNNVFQAPISARFGVKFLF